MARIKGAMMTRKRRNKTLNLAKGYWGSKSKHFKMAKEAVMKSGNYAEKISRVKTYEYEGDDWFLVIPKYYDTVIIKKGDEEAYTEDGAAFIVRCNSDVLVNVFNVTDMNFTLAVDEDGMLKGTEHNICKPEDSTIWGPDNFVWDITHLINK